MLTTDISTLQAGVPSRRWLLEFDREYGHVQVFGQGDVCYSRSGRGESFLESRETGGCYTEPQTIADVQLWNAEEHFLAVFPDEASMRAGGRQLAREWGGRLPAGIHRVLIPPASARLQYPVPGWSGAEPEL
jgi:hypothetical protein